MNISINSESVEGVLSRSEMKQVMAGDDCCDGNIHCDLFGLQWRCNLSTLEECLDHCSGHFSCGGCAQFPEMSP